MQARGDILIVDDNAGVRRLLRAILSSSGHRITEAVDGSHALSLLLRASFDVMITDLDMGPLDGFGLLALMSKLPPDRRARKSIVCSGRIGEPEIDRRPELRLAFRRLPKPIEARALLEAVAAALPQPPTRPARLGRLRFSPFAG
jgi:CheY-like chemotaxis protein